MRLARRKQPCGSFAMGCSSLSRYKPARPRTPAGMMASIRRLRPLERTVSRSTTRARRVPRRAEHVNHPPPMALSLTGASPIRHRPQGLTLPICPQMRRVEAAPWRVALHRWATCPCCCWRSLGASWLHEEPRGHEPSTPTPIVDGVGLASWRPRRPSMGHPVGGVVARGPRAYRLPSWQTRQAQPGVGNANRLPRARLR